MDNREQRLNEIWAEDKLDRRAIAEQVEAYIRGRFEQPAPGTGSFTLAIEGSYGLGKSFFLERLKQQLSLSYPVAFVNAWTDDTANDPLTSIFLAIEIALEEKLGVNDNDKRRRIADRLKDVAKIAAKVAVRGAGSILLTKQGLEEIESAFEAGVDDVFGLQGKEQVQTALVSKRKLIDDFQCKLSELLKSLEKESIFQRPLIIIVDELDRCRPTYAVSLLEEAKHFFDDTGTVFLYGMNRQALAATVKSIYGTDFPADHYLMRFVRRQLALPETSLHEFVSDQWSKNAHLTDKMFFPDRDGSNNPSQSTQWLADLFSANAIQARDAEHILELIFSFSAMWDKNTFIHLPYLSYLAVARYRDERGDRVGRRLDRVPMPFDGFLPQQEAGANLAIRYEQVADLTYEQLRREINRSNSPNSLIMSVLAEIRSQHPDFKSNQEHSMQQKSFLSTYRSRLEQVGAFLRHPDAQETLATFDS